MFKKTMFCVFAAALAAPMSAQNAPDILTDSVQPLRIGFERARFVQATGADLELDKAEFEANVSADRPFARPYDKWSTLIGFDANGNKTIDWLEASNYRSAFSDAVISTYDKDSNKRLEGEERKAAIEALIAGKLPQVTRPDRNRPAAPAPRPGRGNFNREEFMARFDTDGDGQLNEEERANAQLAGVGFFRQRLIERYDRDGDGQLTGDETLEMQPQEQFGYKMMSLGYRHFDANGDGDFDQVERQEMIAFGRKIQQVGEEWRDAVLDINGDGQITQDERQSLQQRGQAAAFQLLPRLVQWNDTDGDGQVTEAERNAALQRVSRVVDQQIETWTSRYDSDGDGRLTAPERDALIAGIKADGEERYNRHDLDGDGQLSVPEMTAFLEELAGEWGVKPTTFQ